MLNNLEELKRRALDCAKEVQSSGDVDPVIIRNSEIAALMDKVEKERFKIALVSIFSAGKSTFINALLGAELLPMDELAWTASVTRIVYSEEIFVTVRYNGKRPDAHFSGNYKGKK